MSAGRPPSASDYARSLAELLQEESELLLRDVVILTRLIVADSSPDADRDCHAPVKDAELHEGWRFEHGEAVRVR